MDIKFQIESFTTSFPATKKRDPGWTQILTWKPGMKCFLTVAGFEPRLLPPVSPGRTPVFGKNYQTQNLPTLNL